MIQMSSTVPLDLSVEKFTILSIVVLDQIRLSCTKGIRLSCTKALLKEEDGEEPESQSATWVNEVDRGGLWHVICGHGRGDLGAFLSWCYRRCRERLCTAVSSDDEVLFHWCLLTAQSEEVHAQTVFDMLVSMWITVRGFAFASTFVEMYKQEKRTDYNGSRHLEKTSIRHDLPHSIHYSVQCYKILL